MSELKVNSIKGTGASTAAITIDSSSGGCTANITNNLTNRNKIINGAMLIAQRGTSSTSTGYQTVDRLSTYHGNTDEAPTYSQADVAAGTTPYSLGFRKSFKITNGNQTSGAGASDEIQVDYAVEAQDLANSGWDYTSASSFITLSYWVKSSVAQEFKGHILTKDGTQYNFPYSLGSLSANTWTKVTKTIQGNPNLQIDNNNGSGLQINLFNQMGTALTGSVTEDTWAPFSASTRTQDQTLTWYTTNDATFEITGVQLEVGSVATDFEHRSFGQELALCQRYFYKYDIGGIQMNLNRTGGRRTANVYFPTTMRDNPSVTITTQFDDGGATIEADNIRTYGFIFKQASSSASNDAPNVSVFTASAEL